MGQFFDAIPAQLIPWIESQKIFWVATAPLAEDGHVNVSPKGCFEKTLNVVLNDDEGVQGRKQDSRAVWYEDLTGSGIETIAHIRENGRITLMLCAFDGPPRIVRLYGTGNVYELGTPEYNKLLPPERRQPGSRAVVWVDVHKVGSSCGYSIPFFDYKAPRAKLHKGWVTAEKVDMEYELGLASVEPEARYAPAHNVVSMDGAKVAEKGIKRFWRKWNLKSQDGLPGLLDAHKSEKVLGKHTIEGEVMSILLGNRNVEVEGIEGRIQQRNVVTVDLLASLGKVVFGIGVGFVAGFNFARWGRA